MPGTLQTGEIVRPDLLQVPRNRFAGLITATSCRRCRWQRRYADVRVFTDVLRDVLTHTHRRTLAVGALSRLTPSISSGPRIYRVRCVPAESSGVVRRGGETYAQCLPKDAIKSA